MINGTGVPPGGLLLRPVADEDAEGLLRAYRRNREQLAPWEPRRGEAFFTLAGQRARLADQLGLYRDGRALPCVLLDGERVVGTVTLSNLSLGFFCSANLGYWIDAEYQGRGLATAAVERVCRVGGEQLGLHRIEAGTLTDNLPSQRVLAKCGFEAIGTAPRYLHINGQWWDHRLFQRILHDGPPAAPPADQPV